VSFPAYGQYRESGVGWIGDVPSHWKVMPLKRLVEVPITDGPHETPDFFEDGVPFVSAEAISSGRIDFSRIRAYISKSDNERYSVKYSPRLYDIYMVKSGATTGTTAMVEGRTDFNIWSPLAVVRCGDKVLPRYVLNFMRSRNFLEAITLNWSFGTQQNIGMGVIENLPCLVPPHGEQLEIAAFLDHETAKIDVLVAEQERLIALLKEKRQAVISHAVTKGLNPNAPMKDSGVEWLGQVPAHWIPTMLGRVCIKVADGPHYSPEYTEAGILFISARNIRVDGWSLDDAKYISDEDYMEFCRRVVPEVGDVLYTKGGTTGIARVVDILEPFQVWVHVAVIKINKKSSMPYFIAYALNSTGCYEQSQLHTRGATNQDLGLNRMTKIWLALPPLNEQLEIVAYLDGQIAKLDSLVNEVIRVVDILKERRAALISAAVTGKIDVRGFVRPEQQAA
jgi:type I restriction enzyme, S subunit